MNTTLQTFARQQLKEGLAKLPENWQETFKLMYGRQGGERSVEDTKAMTVEAVIAEIPDDKLDWAMQQVEKSIRQQVRCLRFWIFDSTSSEQPKGKNETRETENSDCAGAWDKDVSQTRMG